LATEEPKQDGNDSFWSKLGDELVIDYRKDYESLIKSDAVNINGTTYKFNPIKGKDILQFKKLDSESFKIEDKDGQDWYNNVKARACMIIQDMNEEKFDDGDYNVLENITTAWSSRQVRGFHHAKQSVSNVV